MLSSPQEGPAEEGLCSSLLRLVQNDHQVQQLRKELGAFSHRCRNLLHGMKMSFYFVRRGAVQPLPPWWDCLERNYEGIEQLLNQLQAIYRPIVLTPVHGQLGRLIEDRQRHWSSWFETSRGTLRMIPPASECAGDFDPMCLTMGLDALVRWRALAIPEGGAASLSWKTEGDQFEATWDESAGPPGLPPTLTGPDGPGSTPPLSAHQPLALPLLARVLTAHRGTIDWSFKPNFRTCLRWPLLQQTDACDSSAAMLPACDQGNLVLEKVAGSSR